MDKRTDEVLEPAAALAADVEVLAACLEIHRRFELRDQLDHLVECCTAWTDCTLALAFGPTEDRRLITPLTGSLPADDSRVRAVRGVPPARVDEWLAGQPRLFDAFGPFESLFDRWPDRSPAHCLALPVHEPGEQPPAALVLVMHDAAPAPAPLGRLERLLREIRPAVGNAMRVRAMRDLVIKDDTAQCFNRRYFESTLPAELSRASRFHAPLSLIFLDMDNLKEVNKRYGHAMGSRTLFEVSRRVRVKIRRFDKLFRFGGDEFCIVLPETEWNGAAEVAERVRDAIASRPFLGRELGDGRGIRMTASLGVASYPLHARTQRELIEHADRAMQRIKNATKNSIGIAEIAGGKDGD